MDFKLIRRLIFVKLREKNTYVLAGIVGLLINFYGQILVPWFRGIENPSSVLMGHFETHPGLTICSVFLAFAFPLCVGVYSAVTARYKIRRIESVAEFPDAKPDPVFRVTPAGQFLEIGTTTQAFFEQYKIQNAQGILGKDVWEKIKSGMASDSIGEFQFEPEGTSYIVKYTPTRDKNYNIYLTRL